MTLADLRLAVHAFRGVSTSGAMPDWRTYRQRVEARRACTAVAETTLADLQRVIRGRCVTPRTTPMRAIAALVSFSDDHRAPLPHEMLPREATRTWIDDVACATCPLSPAEQLARALAITDDAWIALLVCHLGSRQLARGRDVRALGDDAPTDLETRLALGAAITAFPDALACGGDPLGDTYHYWANVAAGALAACSGAATGHAIERLFRAGPTLMSLVREGLFGSTLFYGNHARIDALGLDHGLALSDAYAPRRRGHARLGVGLAATSV